MNPLIVAIDTADIAFAQRLMRQTAPHCGMFKFGLEYFTAHGHLGVLCTDKPFFLDLKYHDIPSTVGKAVRAATRFMRPYMLTVHASGGADMLKAARDAVEGVANRPLVIAVTRLTSTKGAVSAETFERVTRPLAEMALQSGADGLTARGHEVRLLRAAFGDRVTLVVPGVRTTPLPDDDQVGAVTPKQALNDGASYLVVGRPITGVADPAEAARSFTASA